MSGGSQGLFTSAPVLVLQMELSEDRPASAPVWVFSMHFGQPFSLRVRTISQRLKHDLQSLQPFECDLLRHLQLIHHLSRPFIARTFPQAAPVVRGDGCMSCPAASVIGGDGWVSWLFLESLSLSWVFQVPWSSAVPVIEGNDWAPCWVSWVFWLFWASAPVCTVHLETPEIPTLSVSEGPALSEPSVCPESEGPAWPEPPGVKPVILNNPSQGLRHQRYHPRFPAESPEGSHHLHQCRLLAMPPVGLCPPVPRTWPPPSLPMATRQISWTESCASPLLALRSAPWSSSLPRRYFTIAHTNNNNRVYSHYVDYAYVSGLEITAAIPDPWQKKVYQTKAWSQRCGFRFCSVLYAMLIFNEKM